MNKARIEKAIAIMRRAEEHDSLFMPFWQLDPNNRALPFVTTEHELHACGNRACFAGHIAVSPEFQEDGGCRGQEGEPVFNEHSGSDAIREWLGISDAQACQLVFGDATGIPPCYPDDSEYYGKAFGDVTARDVIAKLEQLLEQTK